MFNIPLPYFNHSLPPPPPSLSSLNPPLFLSCVSQNDSLAESNEDVPLDGLNTLLTDVSLVSLATGRHAQPLLWPDTDGSYSG